MKMKIPVIKQILNANDQIAADNRATFDELGVFVVNVMAVLSYPQLFEFECPAGLHSHFYWGSILATLVAFGPGRISIDALVLQRLGLRARREA